MEIKNQYDVHVVSFNLKNSNNQEVYKYVIDADTSEEVKLSCVVYLDPSFINKTIDYSTYYFYLSIRSITSDNNSPVQYQVLHLDKSKLAETPFVKLNFSFLSPLQADSKTNLISSDQLVGIQLSCSMASIANQEFYTEFEKGIFLDTAIPVEVVNNGQ